MKITCPECDSELPADAESCQECGTHVVVHAPDIQDEEEEVAPEDVHDDYKTTPGTEPAEVTEADMDLESISEECRELMKLPGIGPMKASILYKAGYTDLLKLKRASVVELMSIKGIGKKDAGRIKAELREKDLLDIRSIELTDEGIVREFQCPLCATVISEFENICYECGTRLKHAGDMLDGDTEKALAFYDDRLKEEGDNAELWYARGATLMGMGDYDHALESFNRAIEIEPENQNAWISKAELFNKMGEPLKAAECFSHVISHSSEPYLAGVSDDDPEIAERPSVGEEDRGDGSAADGPEVEEAKEKPVEEAAGAPAEDERPALNGIMPGMAADEESFAEDEAPVIEEAESDETLVIEEAESDEPAVVDEQAYHEPAEEPAGPGIEPVEAGPEPGPVEEPPVETDEAEHEIIEAGQAMEDEPSDDAFIGQKPIDFETSSAGGEQEKAVQVEDAPLAQVPEPTEERPRTIGPEEIMQSIRPGPVVDVNEKDEELADLDPKILRKILSDHAGEIKRLIVLAKEMDVDINEQKVIISRAVKASKQGDYRNAIETMKEGKIAIFELFRGKIQGELNSLAVVAREVKLEGRDVGEILSDISAAKELLDENRFREAFDLLNKCLATLESIRSG